MGSGSFPENTAAGTWSQPLTSSSTEVTYEWRNPSTHPTWFKGVDRENVTFTSPYSDIQPYMSHYSLDTTSTQKSFFLPSVGKFVHQQPAIRPNFAEVNCNTKG